MPWSKLRSLQTHSSVVSFAIQVLKAASWSTQHMQLPWRRESWEQKHSLEMLNNEKIICQTRLFRLQGQSIIHQVPLYSRPNTTCCRIIAPRGQRGSTRLQTFWAHAYFIACSYMILYMQRLRMKCFEWRQVKRLTYGGQSEGFQQVILP